MKQEDINKIFMMISNEKNTFGLHSLYKNNSALKGLTESITLHPHLRYTHIYASFFPLRHVVG